MAKGGLSAGMVVKVIDFPLDSLVYEDIPKVNNAMGGTKRRRRRQMKGRQMKKKRQIKKEIQNKKRTIRR